MRVLLMLLLVCGLVAGCASPKGVTVSPGGAGAMTFGF
ncbi:hypothetical protein LMIY3S_04150 [Labrys miyagiensis]